MDNDKTLEISGQMVAIGTHVNVLWLGKWYEGEVLELGKQNLYKVKDSESGLSVLLDQSQLKVIDKTRPTHEHYSPGAEIAYYDNSLTTWLTGIIEEINLQTEAVYVEWSRDDVSSPNLNWFDISSVAPIISNEAYGIEVVVTRETRDEGEEDEGMLSTVTSKSKLQLPSMSKIATLEEVLEEVPRHRKNSMFQDVGNTLGGGFPNKKPFENRLPTLPNTKEKQFIVEEHDTAKLVKSHKTSVSMKHYYSGNFNNELSQHSDSKLERYVQTQKALLHGTVDHSLLPPVWSYFTQHKGGIPPHPSSRYFRHNNSDSRLPRSGGQYYGSQGWVRKPSGPTDSTSFKRTRSEHFSQGHHLSRSVTMNSEPSDVSPYAQVFFSSQGKHRPLRHYATDMSTRPLPALPNETTSLPGGGAYEVPLPLSSPSSWSNLPMQQRAKPNNYYTPRLEKFDEIVTSTDVKAPTIVSSSKNETMVSAGGTITFFCEATSDTPVTYEWIRNGLKLTNNDDRVAFPSPGSLQLYGLCIADAGTYQCQVSNEGGMATYKCELYVEEESLKKSFSREDGLDKLAKDLPLFDNVQTKSTAQKSNHEDTISLTSISLDEPDDDFHSQAPAYDDYPLTMVRHTLSLASLNATIDQKDHAKLLLGEEDENTTGKKKKKKETKERKTKKEKRRRVSNVLIDVDDYLEGYGEDYGEKTDDKILASAIFNQKKKEKSSSKKKAKKKSKKDKNTSAATQPVEHNNDNDATQIRTPVDLTSPNSKQQSTQQDPTKQDTSQQTRHPVISVEEEVMIEYNKNGDHIMIREEGEGQESSSTTNNNTLQQQKDTSQSLDSINAHPSYESLLDKEDDESNYKLPSQEREAGEGKEEGEEDHLSLPQETQHYLERVTQLQQSTVEYEKEHGFVNDDIKKNKKSRRGFFKSNKQADNELTVI